ncbi:redoxin domain-containing protein [candidate division KSB1 bacterium]|nr:redoxin domain-containing protein [candidate division KSB1 bacterium]
MLIHCKHYWYTVLIITGICSVNAGEIQGTIRGLQSQRAYLYGLYGDEYILVDSTWVESNGWVYFEPAEYPTGFYNVQFDSGLRLDLILDQDPVLFSTHAKAVIDSMQVKTSRETHAYYQLIRQDRMYDGLVASIEQILQQYHRDEKEAGFIVNLKQELERLNTIKRDERKKLCKEYPGTMVAMLLAASETPNRNSRKEYLAAYPDEKSFLREHFFDNIDFTDSRILRSPFLAGNYRRYLDWIEPRDESSFMTAISNLLGRTKINPLIHSYTIGYLTRYFKRRAFPNVLEYLASLCLADSLCQNESNDLENGLSLLGKRAPQINLPDPAGTFWNNHQLDSEFVMIVFWSPECESCHITFQHLQDFSHIPSEHLSVFTVALSDNEFLWRDTLEWSTGDFIHTIDPEGHDSHVAKNYLIDSIPAIFITDRKGIIRTVSSDISVIQEQLNHFLKQYSLDKDLESVCMKADLDTPFLNRID